MGRVLSVYQVLKEMFKNHSYPPVSIGAIVEENSKVRALENKLLERKEREVGVLAQSNCGLVSN